MHRFWRSVIEPVLEILEPERILEIGSDRGPNTEKLLGFCEEHGAQLHVIDPLPGYDVAEWRERYGESLVFHQTTSLDALPQLDGFDVALIDGDHNWYTVFNELKLIKARCESTSHPLPLIMLHDVGWPYGRRDGYYDPDNIPEPHRNAFERKGMRQESSGLVEENGFNQGFCNAVQEGGPRNGVLGAVEDFLAQAEQYRGLRSLPGLHGLGILVPQHLEGNERLSELLDSLIPTPAMAQHLEALEEAHLEAETIRQKLGAELRRLENQWGKEIRTLRARHQETQRQLDQTRRRAARLEEQLKELQSRRSVPALLRKLRRTLIRPKSPR